MNDNYSFEILKIEVLPSLFMEKFLTRLYQLRMSLLYFRHFQQKVRIIQWFILFSLFAEC